MQTFGVNVVILRGREVLLTLRSDLPVWCVPGGAIESAESMFEAAKREAYEEAGVEIAITGLVGVYSRPRWRNDGNHEAVFVGHQIGGELIPQDGEALDVRYFSLDELPNDLLWWHRERIEDAAQGLLGVARSQDARFILPDLPEEVARQKVADGEISVEEVVRYFCDRPLSAETVFEIPPSE